MQSGGKDRRTLRARGTIWKGPGWCNRKFEWRDLLRFAGPVKLHGAVVATGEATGLAIKGTHASATRETSFGKSIYPEYHGGR